MQVNAWHVYTYVNWRAVWILRSAGTQYGRVHAKKKISNVRSFAPPRTRYVANRERPAIDRMRATRALILETIYVVT